MQWLVTLQHSCYALATIKNVAVFCSGVLCTVLYYRYWKDRRDDVKDPDNAPHQTSFRWLWVAAAIGVALFMFIAVRTQVSAEHSDTALAWTRQQAADAKNQAEHNKQCFNHLADVMRQRGILSDTIDPQLQSQIDNLGHWLDELGTPPANIANTHTTDDAYQNYVAMLRDKYSKLVGDARQQADDNSRKRANNPVPDPSCPQ